ncbi:hypothetical protein V9K67_13330 [Paraflavisolibacter sp. H34]|uniref:hypothetical protein n=1 Tax=Huijunlia imazamoxiresistens TaxID=3127457 RepID=UPI0030184834
MLTALIVFRCIIALVVSISSMYVSGKLLFRICKKNAFANELEQFFWYCLTGLLLLTSCYALLVSGGKTILSCIPFLLLLLVHQVRQDAGEKTVEGRKVLPWIAAGIGIFVAYYLQGFLSPDATYVRYVAGDPLYYARLADYLNYTGVEASTPEYLFQKEWPVNPYHYGDVWVTALIARCSFVPAHYALLLVVYPLLAIIATAGVAGYVRNRFQQPPGPFIYFLLLLVFFKGFAYGYNVAPAFYPKTLWPLCFIAGSFQLVFRKDVNALWIFVAIAGISFLNIGPAFGFGVVLFAGFCALQGQLRLKEMMVGGAACFAAVVFFFIFYSLLMPQTGDSLVPQGQGAGALVKQLPALFFKKLYRQKADFFTLLLFAALVAAGLFVQGGKAAVTRFVRAPEVAWSLLLLLSGLLFWVIAEPFLYDSFQFFYNIVIIVTAISIAVVLYWYLTQAPWRPVQAAAMLLLAALVLRNYQFSFHVRKMAAGDVARLRSFLTVKKQATFFFYNRPEGFRNLLDVNTRFRYPLPVVTYLCDGCIIECLNTPFLLADTSRNWTGMKKNALKLSSFYQYVVRKEPQLKGLSEEAVMRRFLQEYKPDYILLQAGVPAPGGVREAAEDSLAVEGYRVFRMRNE